MAISGSLAGLRFTSALTPKTVVGAGVAVCGIYPKRALKNGTSPVRAYQPVKANHVRTYMAKPIWCRRGMSFRPRT